MSVSMSTRIKKTLKHKLATLVPAWEGRVHDAPASGEVLSGPCAVLAFAEEVPKSAWAGYRRIIKISPYARSEDGGAEQVEVWSTELITGLHQVRLEDGEGGAFTCIYLGSTDSERRDAESGLVTRSLRFGVYVPEPQRTEHADAAGDVWLSALQRWTVDELGPDWSVYTERWPGGYRMPSVLWRLTGYSTAAVGTSALEVRKQWVGHVLTGNTVMTDQTVGHLVEQLALQSRIAFHPRDDQSNEANESIEGNIRYVTVDEVTADMQADAYLNGQLRLTLSQRIRRSVATAPLMREIHHSKGIQ
ncbi:hypothetical protein HNR77_004344 [Paenibacillus sp. JGP012]|uniref:hypothetical protein n=1 Tax=Paenibacillus sp. JGP012 TaxID=2735914 RepID=UPI001607A7AC|nr:hypothetical protein [Paenibacillus sp. JGP012]MBB6023244.1 hypothetical protein [Paenibacillus sp. JGP012]